MSHKILIAEDSIEIQVMLQRKLRKTDWEIHTAENGQIAVEKAFELQPDLILMDMQMPVMDGHEAVRILRKKGYTGIISALTASVMEKETDQALKVGCDYFISKPIDKTFIPKLKEMMGL